MILKMKLKNLLHNFWFFLPLVSAQRCGKNGSFTPHDKYDTNCGLLLSSLASNVSARGGFYNASVGQGPDRLYALGMCIQGANQEVYSNCINLASNGLIENCPNQTEGLTWPENGILCMVRYSNRLFLGSLELEPTYILYNTGEIRSIVTTFDRLWGHLTSHMIAGATSSSSERKYYAAETIPLTSFQNIYALMQCTPIISLEDCNNICLNQSVTDYEVCCHGKQGGIVFRPFSQAFDLTVAPPAQPPTSLPPPLDHKTKRSSKSISAGIIMAIVVPTVIAILVLFALAFLFCRRKNTDQAFTRQGSSIDISTTNQLQFDFKTIQDATDQYSEANVIGQGGFGEVFKAVLNGTEVAIKRLSKAPGQGAREFKNEAVLVAKLQHRNLVRLLGFCVEGEENLIVYKFVPNKSLDYFMFDPSKHGHMDWETRYKIITGIARGVLYLHRDSRLTIIHRDLKASNILLDADMNPKLQILEWQGLWGWTKLNPIRAGSLEPSNYHFPLIPLFG